MNKSKCTVYWLTATKFALEKSVVRLTDRLNMTIVVDWDIKTLNKQTKLSVRS